MKTTAAFFDIDGTLFRQALSVELFKKLAKNNIIPDDRWKNNIKPVYEKWVNREGNYDDYIIALDKVFRENIIGLNLAVLKFFANQVIEEKGERLYRHTKQKMKWHKENGHKIIIISGAPSLLAHGLAKKLGADDCIGTYYMVDDHADFTGQIVPMWDHDSKLRALNDFVAKYDIDLESSYAYGDTNGDLTMLSMVANPTMINPTNELLHNVLKDKELVKKITTIIERKDVIYSIDLNNISILD